MTKEGLGLDRDYMRMKMKERFRMAWKDPGNKNGEFNPINLLRPRVSLFEQVLNEWEQMRCLMPERSYKYYPDRAHIKISHNIEEFKAPPRKGLSEKYIKHLEVHEKKFTDFTLRPSKYGGEIKAQVLLDKINLDSKKETFKLPGTAPGREFGFSQFSSTSAGILKKTGHNSITTALPTVK